MDSRGDAAAAHGAGDESSEVFLHDGSVSGPLGDTKAGTGPFVAFSPNRASRTSGDASMQGQRPYEREGAARWKGRFLGQRFFVPARRRRDVAPNARFCVVVRPLHAMCAHALRAPGTTLDKLVTVLGSRLCVLQLPSNKLSEAAAYSISVSLPRCVPCHVFRQRTGPRIRCALLTRRAQCYVSRFSALQEINLHGNQFGYVGAVAIAQAVTTCASVISLNLSANLIGGKDAQQLMTLLFGPASRLVLLDLSDNKLGNEGAITIAPLCTNDPF